MCALAAVETIALAERFCGPVSPVDQVERGLFDLQIDGRDENCCQHVSGDLVLLDHPFRKAYDVALRIREEREVQAELADLSRRHNGLASELLRFR